MCVQACPPVCNPVDCSPASWWLSSEESTCNAGDTGDTGSIPELGRSPEGEYGNPRRYSCLKNPTARGTGGAIVGEVAESDTTEATEDASHRL